MAIIAETPCRNGQGAFAFLSIALQLRSLCMLFFIFIREPISPCPLLQALFVRQPTLITAFLSHSDLLRQCAVSIPARYHILFLVTIIILSYSTDFNSEPVVYSPYELCSCDTIMHVRLIPIDVKTGNAVLTADYIRLQARMTYREHFLKGKNDFQN